MNYHNITRHPPMSFADYGKLPGYSHSWLKSQSNPIKYNQTFKRDYGSIVDALISDTLTPDLYSNTMYPVARQTYLFLVAKFPFLAQCDSQVAYTGEIAHDGFTMPTKVLLDLQYSDLLLIENKITFSPINTSLYTPQVFHQKMMSGVKDAYLMICRVHPKTYKIIETSFSNESIFPIAEMWWEGMVKLYGK